jgi:hypothetical protein
MKRFVPSLCALSGLLSLAGAAAAGVTITGGTIGGSGNATPGGASGGNGFACTGVPTAGSSCGGSPSALGGRSCDFAIPGVSDVADASAQITLSAAGGAAGTSGGLGDDPDLSTALRAEARGYIVADATAAANGSLSINMCGGTSGTGTANRGDVLATYFANINTPGFTFTIDLPTSDPAPFTESYSGAFASQSAGFAFEPDTSAPNPGAITQENGRDLIAEGAYRMVKTFSQNAGNRQFDNASFSGGYRLTVGTAGTVPGACCRSVGCILVSSPTECNGTYLGENTTCAQCEVTTCCHPWDNGRFDGRGGQTSQIGVDQDWRGFGRVSFDDFWLCEGQINIIEHVSGTMSTNAVVPKFLVVILPDCDGFPVLSEPLAVAGLAGTRFDVDQEDVPFVLGTISWTDNNAPDADGFRNIDVRASFNLKKLALKGGAYWVSIIGVSGNLNPLDEFFWGTAGNNVIKGKPGQFFNDGEWFDSSELCCGCTDYNFCVEGETCKILIDNGGPILASGGPLLFPGVASLQNGSRTSDKSRAADKVVLPPCTLFLPCYLEGWVWTNCDRVALQLFIDDCHCPDDRYPGTELRLADCVMATGITLPDPTGRPVELKRVQFFFDTPSVLTNLLGGTGRVPSGINLWVSLVGLGDNSQNARSYFAFGTRCDHPCTNFGPGCFRPAPFDQTTWRSNGIANTSFPGFDHAFLLAVREARLAAPPVVDPCPADVNHSGDVTVQDIFDFLAAFFTGCP